MDMYAKVEQLRVDLFSGTADAISSGDNNPGEFGRRIRLPSSFTSSPRQMFEIYEGSMSMAGNTVNPICSLHLHVILNGKKSLLLLCQIRKATDRPDLFVRVFKMKLRELLDDICTHHVLGRPLAHVDTIACIYFGYFIST